MLTWISADYKELSQMPNLPPQDMRVVKEALASLPTRINTAKAAEMGEMMGKLKEACSFLFLSPCSALSPISSF